MPARPSRLLVVVVLLLLSVVGPIPEDDEGGGTVRTDMVGVVWFSSADPVLATVRRGLTVVGDNSSSSCTDVEDEDEGVAVVVTGLDSAAVEETECCAAPRRFR